MSEEQICYFGYGSLVNEDTLATGTKVISGTLNGYVREWRGCAHWRAHENHRQSGVCALSVRPESGASIRGAMVLDKKANLPALDDREWHYDRHELNTQVFTPDAIVPVPQDMYLYRIKKDHHNWGSDQFPILQSYVDCVLAGFHRIWGEEGIAHFMETTLGWNRVPVLADRSQPHYPRAVNISDDLAQIIDDALASKGVVYL